jgi:hypothetical protein
MGVPRTASTFQHQLLMAIVSLKSPQVPVSRSFDKIKQQQQQQQELSNNGTTYSLLSNKSYVLKTHGMNLALQIKANDPHHVHIFTSSTEYANYSVYVQQKQNVIDCSLCEVDSYKALFELTNEQVQLIKNYMSVWEKLRRCCGYQMSKYQRAILHKCNITQYIPPEEYEQNNPRCHEYNITRLEHEVQRYNIPIAEIRGWKQPGDCARLDQAMINGKDFNGRRFKGCEYLLSGK